jgi:hypothetical protein
MGNAIRMNTCATMVCKSRTMNIYVKMGEGGAQQLSGVSDVDTLRRGVGESAQGAGKDGGYEMRRSVSRSMIVVAAGVANFAGFSSMAVPYWMDQEKSSGGTERIPISKTENGRRMPSA